MANYYTLFIRFEESDKWSVEFGDYERSCVSQELKDTYEGCFDAKIVNTTDDQAETDKVRNNLNADIKALEGSDIETRVNALTDDQLDEFYGTNDPLLWIETNVTEISITTDKGERRATYAENLIEQRLR